MKTMVVKPSVMTKAGCHIFPWDSNKLSQDSRVFFLNLRSTSVGPEDASTCVCIMLRCLNFTILMQTIFF